MFTKKHDPLVDSVKSVMEKNNLRRQVEEALNEELGISSRKAVPHEHLASYDAMLEEAYKCAMKEADEKDYSKDFHVVGPHGRTVEVTTSEESAKKAAEEYGKGYEVYRGDELPDTWKGSGTGSSMFAGKKKTVKESKEISHPNQTIISKQDGEPESISGEDLAILRAKKKAGEEIKQEEAKVAVGNKSTTTPAKGVPHALEEKATEAQKEKVAEVMREFKKKKLHSGSKKGPKVTDRKQAVAIALSQAGLSRKQKMDESIESIMEEIRANLEEKLVSIYESGDAQMFEEFVTSLTEEQIELLGLSEALGDVFDGPGSTERQSILNRASQQTYLNQQRQAAGQRTVSAARPTAAPAARPTPPTPAARPTPPTPAARPTPPTPAARPTPPTPPAIPSTAAASDKALSDATAAQKAGYGPEGPSGPHPGNITAGRSRTTDRGILGIDRSVPIPTVKPSDIPTVGSGPTGSVPGKTTSDTVKTVPTEQPEQPKKQQPAPSIGDMGPMAESYHIKESLESMIRSRYLKG